MLLVSVPRQEENPVRGRTTELLACVELDDSANCSKAAFHASNAKVFSFG